jgi:hypothetical protein
MTSRSPLLIQLINVTLRAKQRQDYRLLASETDRNGSLGAHIHARYADQVQRSLGMGLIAALDRFLQLCQRAHAGLSLQLLLALAAGQQKLTFPSGRVGFETVPHALSLVGV